jgi:hypothetical protein
VRAGGGGGPVDAGGVGVGEGNGGGGDGVRSMGICDGAALDAAGARLGGGAVDLELLAFDAGTRLRPLSIDADAAGAALAEMFGCGAAATGAAVGAGTAAAGTGTVAAGVGPGAGAVGSGADEGSGCLVVAVGPLAR